MTDTADDEFLRLSAFIDGEASPAERARIAARLAGDPDFARLHATLARLKACVGDLAEDARLAPSPAPRRRFAAAMTTAAATVAAVAAVLLILLPIDPPPQRRPAAVVSNPVLLLAGLPAPVPDLGSAGLRLSDVTSIAGADPAIVASYRGPRGCRVVLRIGLDRGAAAALDTANRWTWVNHGLSYELTAFGMPPARFALIAGAARVATLDPAGAAPAERLLRQARAEAPPCLA